MLVAALIVGLAAASATGAAFVNPSDVLEAEAEQCAALPSQFARVFMGASCFYSEAEGRAWTAGWDMCANAITGGRLAHVYDMDALGAIGAAGLMDADRWYRVGLSAQPVGTRLTNAPVFSDNGGIWRFDRDEETEEDFGIDFRDRANEVTSPYTNFYGSAAYLLHSCTSTGCRPWAYRSYNDGYHLAHRTICEKAAPANEYTLVGKDKKVDAPAGASVQLSPSHSADVRACAHECNVRKWCFMFDYSGGTDTCVLYTLLGSVEAVRAMLIDAAGTNFYARRPAPSFQSECASGPGADALMTRMYQGRCYAAFSLGTIKSMESAAKFCIVKGTGSGKEGRLAYIRSKSMALRLYSMLPDNVSWHCSVVNGRRDEASKGSNGYGNWECIDGDAGDHVAPCHPPPSAWYSNQPNNVNLAEPQLYLCKAVAGLADSPAVGIGGYAHMLCEFDDDSYEPRWTQVADGKGQSYEPMHILDTIGNVPLAKVCGFFCRKHIDCASVAYNPSTKECRLQRYEYSESGAGHVPTSVDKQSAPGFVWYEDMGY